MIVSLLNPVLCVEVGGEETRGMDDIQKPVCLGDSQLNRNQSAGEKRFRLGFRDWRDTRMAGGNQQYRVDERGVWSFGTIRIEQRGVEGDRVNDEAPLVLKREPHIKPSEGS